jgi:DNA-directed RNA polymerase specialized sigma24 family protein
MENPSGYLYRVGCTKARGRRRVLFEAPVPPGDPEIEPELATAMTRLSANQRTAVVLVKGYGWELHEVAELTGSSVSTVNTHVRRGLAKLRTELGVEP